ncbi:carboxymuconolactone decarboxylase family protein [Lichenicoccus sp.]|uniref:carboxymuconolactone decarboxylase family protein n=1 Tax=Lichenicoccus sp. TaxID=2781899 RepID=UPI003D13E77B
MPINKELYDRGLAIRTEVVGPDHVKRALESANTFTQPMQDLVTEFCWGAIWGREGLERKTRSLINLAMLSVLNRPNELKAHVRGAVRNGCTMEEIREVLLQVAVYAGVPAAIDSFRAAREVLDEVEAESKST